MPKYTLKCTTCGREVDVMRVITDRDQPQACTPPPVEEEDGRQDVCPGVMTRTTLEMTAFTPYSWQP